MWAVMSSEKSRSPATAIKVSKSRHNSRTKLRMKLLHIQKRDNVEFYLCCKFQLSPFSVRRKTDVKDGVTNKLGTKGADASVGNVHSSTRILENRIEHAAREIGTETTGTISPGSVKNFCCNLKHHSKLQPKKP